MAVHSYGTTLSFGSAIAELTNVQPGKTKIKAINSTHLASTSATMTFLPGLIEEGEMTFTLWYAKAQLITLRSYLRSIKAVTITLPDGGVGTGSAFITELDPGKADEDGLIETNVTAQVTAAFTWA